MTAGSPIAALAALMQGGGGAPSGSPSPMAAPPLGQQVSQQLADLNGADPQMLLRQLQNWKAGVTSLIPHVAFRIPKMVPHLSQTLKGLDRAIESAAEAATTAATVGAPPIGMSAASPLDGANGPVGGPF